MTESVWGPVHQDMTALLADHPDDVPAVVDQLTKLQDILDRVPPLLGSNPLADFNKLYLTNHHERSGASVRRPVRRPGLPVPARRGVRGPLLRRHPRTGATRAPCCPRVWAVLFGRIAGPDCRPLPSAAAGVNAHINFDLPFALVTTFDHLGSDPVDDSDQHHDYLQINDVFAEAIPELRRGYLDRWQLLIDTMNGDLDDCWQGEMVEYTRNVAWRNAQRLWAVRHDMAALALERNRLDGNAAALGRLLLSPMGTFLQ